jgi:hypothetical protein
MALFGRKKTNPPAERPSGPSGAQKDQPGHQAVLEHLVEQEKTDPGIRERLVGAVLFDLVSDILQDERGVRIENLLAVLASVAGQECIAPILAAGADDSTMEQLGLTVIKGQDGRFYFFGDQPNRLLVESADSVISLAFGAAQARGGPVTMSMITDEMSKVASRIGGPDFETLDLPPEHMVDRPTEWARVFRPKLAEALDLYDVPPMRRAAALGYALQKAIGAPHNLDALIAARIVLQCATRTAKVIVA